MVGTVILFIHSKLMERVIEDDDIFDLWMICGAAEKGRGNYERGRGRDLREAHPRACEEPPSLCRKGDRRIGWHHVAAREQWMRLVQDVQVKRKRKESGASPNGPSATTMCPVIVFDTIERLRRQQRSREPK